MVPIYICVSVQVCLMSQSWDNLASMHDHLYMLTKHRDIVHAQTVSCLGKIVHYAPVNGMPQYPPPAPSRGILGDLTLIISIAPGSEQYLKSNPLFST